MIALPPVVSFLTPRKIFPSYGAVGKDYTKILQKRYAAWLFHLVKFSMISCRSLDAPLEPLVSKKARVFIEGNCKYVLSYFVSYNANTLDHVRSDDDASENSVELSPRRYVFGTLQCHQSNC